jgi:hypothetical protein
MIFDSAKAISDRKDGTTMRIKHVVFIALAALALSLASIEVTAPAIAGGHSTSGDFYARLGAGMLVAPQGALAGSKPGIAGGSALAGSKPGVAPETLIAGGVPGGVVQES